MSRDNIILEVKHLTVGYSQKKPVVKDVSFLLRKGECLAIFGKLGSGKTTIAMAILGFIAPIYGMVLLNSINILKIRGRKRREIRRRIQPIFQDPFLSLHPMKRIKTVLEDSIGRESGKSVKRYLNMVGLDASYMDRLPSQLSGGELQRVCIAKALCTNPEVLILDEPFTAQDHVTKVKLAVLLRDLKNKYNLSYLLITHDIFTVSFLSDRVLLLDQGKVTGTMTAGEFREKYIAEL